MANQVELDGTKFGVGDSVKIHLKIREGERSRTQVFDGLVIAIRGRGDNKSFTVRKIASGAVGVERIFPVISPWISKVSVTSPGKVRRAKLYYLRGRTGKEALAVKKKKTKKVERVKMLEKVEKVEKVEKSKKRQKKRG